MDNLQWRSPVSRKWSTNCIKTQRDVMCCLFGENAVVKVMIIMLKIETILSIQHSVTDQVSSFSKAKKIVPMSMFLNAAEFDISGLDTAQNPAKQALFHDLSSMSTCLLFFL